MCAGYDPLSNLGSLKNDLLLPPNFKNDNHDDEELEDDFMILGTTPNVGSGTTGTMLAAAAVRSGAAARANASAYARENVHHELISRCIDEEDELMGMSPDIPSMFRSPLGGAGFGDFMKAHGAAVAQSSLVAAAAASNEQVPTMTRPFLHTDNPAQDN